MNMVAEPGTGSVDPIELPVPAGPPEDIAPQGDRQILRAKRRMTQEDDPALNPTPVVVGSNAPAGGGTEDEFSFKQMYQQMTTAMAQMGFPAPGASSGLGPQQDNRDHTGMPSNFGSQGDNRPTTGKG